MKLKKSLLVLLAVFGYCQFMFSTPIITMPSSATFTVGNYGKVEIPFNLNAYANPYAPTVINAYCEFWSPTNVYYKVNAFYYNGYTQTPVPLGNCPPLGTEESPTNAREDLTPIANSNKWLIRFTPNETGVWKYKITAKDAGGTATFPSGAQKLPNFTCVTSSNQGFITKANNRFLKRTTGEFFFPVGPNVAWFESCGSHTYGTYEYKYYLDKLFGNANFIRVWLDWYRGAAIVGHDAASGMNYFDLYDQEDSWRMDYIFEYAKSKNINIQLCFNAHSSWGTAPGYDGWPINPFNSANGGPLNTPYEFLTNPNAISRTKNLIRYTVARWGYSTNLMAWELWNEVNQLSAVNTIPAPPTFAQDMVDWHNTMYQWVRDNDPFDHLVTTSWAGDLNSSIASLFANADFTTPHNYYFPGGDFQSAYYNSTLAAQSIDKPTMHQEWGIYPLENATSYVDPHGFELHSLGWSSSFSTAMGSASTFSWKETLELYNLGSLFKPMKDFMNAQSIPSQAAIPTEVTNVNGLRAYYLAEPDYSSTMGWVQDINFQFMNLFDPANPNDPTSYLQTFNPIDKPGPSSNNNNFQIPVQAGKVYIIEWYSAETGLLYQSSNLFAATSLLNLTIPQNLRESAYGDAIFKVYVDCNFFYWRDGAMSNTPTTNVAGNVICNKATGQVFYKSSDNRIHSNSWNSTTQSWDWSNLNNAAANVAGDLVISPDGNTVYYRTLDNRIKCIYLIQGTNNWTSSSNLNGITNAAGPLAVAPNNQVFYCATDNKIRAVSYNFSTNAWVYDPLASGLPANCGNSIAIGPGTTAGSFEVFYKTTDNKINSLYKNINVWTWSNLNNTASGVTSNIAVNSLRQVFYTTADNKLHQIYWGSGWLGGAALPLSPANVGGDIMVAPNGVNSEVFYRTNLNSINSMYYSGASWYPSNLNNCLPNNSVVPGWISGTDFSSIYYRANNNTVRRIYYKSQCFTTPSPSFEKNLDITDSKEESSSFERSDAEADLQLFPNPAFDKLTINSSELIAAYAIYNLSGEQLMQKDEVNEVSQELEIESLSNGVYFARVYLKTGQIIFRKFVVSHER